MLNSYECLLVSLTCVFVCLFVCLSVCLFACSVGWVGLGWFEVCLFVCLFVWLVGWLVGWWVGCGFGICSFVFVCGKPSELLARLLDRAFQGHFWM